MKLLHCSGMIAGTLISFSALAFEGDHRITVTTTVPAVLTVTQVNGDALASSKPMEHKAGEGLKMLEIPVKIAANHGRQVEFNLKINKDPMLSAASSDNTTTVNLEVKLDGQTLSDAGHNFSMDKTKAENLSLEIHPLAAGDLPADDYIGEVLVSLAPKA